MKNKKLNLSELILKKIWIDKKVAYKDLNEITPEAKELCLDLKNLKIINYTEGCWVIPKKIGRQDITSYTILLEVFKKKKSFRKSLNNFRTFDLNEPKGSEEDWRRIAETILFNVGDKDYKTYLKTLGFVEIPTLKELNKAYKNIIKVTHPDRGGSNELASKVIEAYTKLKTLIK